MHSPLEQQIFSIERPSRALWHYYILICLLFGPFFFIPLVYYHFRFQTMRYSFDDEGISMKWGILFRREIMLTYARVQDIHLTSNIVERWLKLARIQIQTASASASAEMTIEGLHEFAEVRDFLYTKMRGVRASASQSPALHVDAGADSTNSELAATLREVAAELRSIREALGKRPS